MKTISARFLPVLITVLGVVVLVSPGANAQTATQGNFSLQLSPSPMVQTIKPGVASTVPLKIRNNGSSNEALKIEIRHFTFDSASGKVNIADTTASDLSNWVTFSNSQFSVAPNQEYTENVNLNFPSNSGFSYSFVYIITRQSEAKSVGAGRVLNGSIADFALINVDKPGATKALELTSIKTSSGIYEYAPAQISVLLKNTGNTIVQPIGDIFVGRGNVDKPIDTLKFNETQSYILPNTSRTIKASWDDAFPRTVTETAADGTTKTHNEWNWGNITKFRIGAYTAKVVAVYNNGTYDVPLNAQTTFWIIPWKIILIALVIILVFAFGIFMIVRAAVRSRPRGGSTGFRL